MPESIQNLLQWYKDSGLQDATITVSLLELVILFLLLTGCLLLRFPRTGLIIAFLFVFRWGWMFCMSSALVDSRMRTLFLTGYVVFGILAVTMATVAMVLSKRYSSEE